MNDSKLTIQSEESIGDYGSHNLIDGTYFNTTINTTVNTHPNWAYPEEKRKKVELIHKDQN